MNPNHDTIRRFYQCLAGGDHCGMQQCLHPDAAFADIGFDLRGRQQVGAMWHMICEKDPRIMFRDVVANETGGTARWECHYDFQTSEDSDPRHVYNRIRSRFLFEDGLIREQFDDCDFADWARQALGLADIPAGQTGIIQQKVRESAAAKIAAFVAAHPEYA